MAAAPVPRRTVLVPTAGRHHVDRRGSRGGVLATTGGVPPGRLLRLVECLVDRLERRVVQHRLEVRARVVLRLARDGREVDVVAQAEQPRLGAQDVEAVRLLRHGAAERLVQAAGPQQRRVDQVRPRRRRQHVHAAKAFRAVHLREQLVDHAVGHAGRVVAAPRRDGVKLVEEQHARLGGGGALKQVARRLLGRANVLAQQLRPCGGGAHAARVRGLGERPRRTGHGHWQGRIPLTLTKLRPHSLATADASIVLPQPGGP